MRRFYRSSSDSVFFGVCGGLAEYFDLDPNLVRFAVVVASIATAVFPAIIIYIAATVIFPER